jgi:hypothetical protein
VLVPCIESKKKIVLEQSDEHRGFVKWEHNYIQNRRGVLAEEASDLMKRFCY